MKATIASRCSASGIGIERIMALKRTDSVSAFQVGILLARMVVMVDFVVVVVWNDRL